jgi:hypothetical protein
MVIITITHLVLSLLFGVLVISHGAMAGGIYEESFHDWSKFELIVFCLLQPQFGLAYILRPQMWESSNCSLNFILGVSNFAKPLMYSIPLWSVCFGLIFMRAIGWRTRHSQTVTCHS